MTGILCLGHLDPITIVAREGAGLWWRSGARGAAAQWLRGVVAKGEGKGTWARSVAVCYGAAALDPVRRRQFQPWGH